MDPRDVQLDHMYVYPLPPPSHTHHRQDYHWWGRGCNWILSHVCLPPPPHTHTTDKNVTGGERGAIGSHRMYAWLQSDQSGREKTLHLLEQQPIFKIEHRTFLVARGCWLIGGEEHRTLAFSNAVTPLPLSAAAALCKGVLPPVFLCFAFAPNCNSTGTLLLPPFSAATINAVFPRES
jgi:hypothetical protein